jgi:hypothetical protein
MRLALCAALALLASTSSNPALADAPPPANQPSAKVGDVIEYDARLGTVACKRWEVTEATDAASVLQCGNNLASIANGNLMKIVTKSGDTLVEFKPYAQSLFFPLETGKKWEGKYVGYTASNGATWNGDNSCEVKPPETVKVAAGEFEAYRIDCVDSWKSGQFSGQSHTSAWYAPKVGTTVKSVNTENPEWSFEITSIARK